MNNFISILIPAKNAGNFLRECLQSIVDQSISNWEVIVVNDHSEDHTADILEEFSQKHERISWFENNHGTGIIPALRLALSKSKGNFITRMDADDVMPPEKLELLFSACKDGAEDSLASGKVKYFSSDELGNGFINYQNWLNSLIEQENPFSEVYRECPIASPNWMMRRSFLEEIGAFKPDVYPEDYDLIFRAYEKGAYLQLVKTVTHFWRDHLDRASRNDPNYRDNSFLDLKMHYFLQIDHNRNKELRVHGAGWRAKKIARLLLEQNIHFTWFTNNQKKIGQDIFGVVLKNQEEMLINVKQAQILVSISSPEDQKRIASSYRRAGLEQGSDYFFFC